MVDEIVTRQELIDAKRDARDLGKAVNEKVIVSPRYGGDFKSLPMVAEEFQDAIEAAAAAGAGANGWTALLVRDSSGLNQQEVNDLTSHIEFYGATGGSDDSEAFYTAILNNKEIVLSSGKTYSLRLDNFDCQGNNVIIRGDGTARLKLITGSGGSTSALNVSGSNKAIISGVDVFTERSAISNIFTLNETAFVGELSSTKCGYSGFARFLSAIGSKTQLFETAPFGIGRLVFSDNTSIDSERGMIYISDMPVLDAEIYRNNVTNFSGQFISINITNGAANTASVTRNRNIRAKYNTVHCTDDFWMTSSHSQYYTFLLFEGLEAVWTNNDVSGMKTEVAGIVVYDTYLYAVNPTMKNNTWKNIAGFSDSAEGNRVVQTKAESVGEFKCVKVITDNTYIIEDEWLERIGKSSCTHRLYRLGVDNCGDVTFSRNIFKLNTLTDSSIHKGEKFVLEGNQITAKRFLINFSLFWFAPLSTEGSLLKLKSNGFKTLDESSGGGIFLSANPSSPAWGELVIEDNTGDAANPGLTTFLNEVSSSKTRILRNTITGSFADLNYSNEKWLGEFLIEDNNFICTRANGSRPHVGLRLPTKGFLKDTFIGVHEYIIFPVYNSQINVIKSPLTYLISVELYTKTGKMQVEFVYSLTYESGVYKVSFVNNLDATIVATLGTSEADRTVVKSSSSGLPSLSVVIRNTVSGATFGINGVPTSEHIKSVISINAF